jgi:hypothetical protein
MLGSYLSAAYQSRPSEKARRFFASLLQWAGVQAPLAVTGGEVEVRITESGADRILFVFNHSRQQAAPAIRLLDAPEVRGRDLITEAEVPLVREGSTISLTGSVPPGEVRVILLTAR